MSKHREQFVPVNEVESMARRLAERLPAEWLPRRSKEDCIAHLRTIEETLHLRLTIPTL
jgi:hypothetical protein